VDTHLAVWRSFHNHFWPAIYLVDAEGVSGTTASARAATRRPRG
jgi:hypothetical protein